MKKIVTNHLSFILIFIIISFFYIYKLGQIPNGLFIDEAEIGWRALEIFHGTFSGLHYMIFYHHLEYDYGSLPVFTTLPFVLFSLSEFTVRFSSVFFLIASLIAIYLILENMYIKNAFLTILFFAFTPLVFHLSRVAFGQTQSMFFLLLGYLFYLKSKFKKNLYFSFLSGIFLGISLYGYSAYIIISTIFLGTLILTEILINKNIIKFYKYIFTTGVIFLIFLLPFIVSFKLDTNFKKRFNEKKGGIIFLSSQHFDNMIKNYPKYYSLDFLFLKSEDQLPGGFLTRHSVRGKGILFSSTFIFLPLSLFFLFKKRETKNIYLLPFFLFILLFPLVDLLTTNSKTPPYSVSIFSSLFFLPFIVVPFFDVIKNKIVLLIFFIFIFGEFIQFYFNDYLKYPIYSSDYWGWQAGSKEIVKYFLAQKDNYDSLYMSGDFNGQPQVLLNFYDPNHLCKNCRVAGIEAYNPKKKQLFALRIVSYNQYVDKKYFKIKKTIYLPNGQPEFYIGEYFK